MLGNVQSIAHAKGLSQAHLQCPIFFLHLNSSGSVTYQRSNMIIANHTLNHSLTLSSPHDKVSKYVSQIILFAQCSTTSTNEAVDVGRKNYIFSGIFMKCTQAIGQFINPSMRHVLRRMLNSTNGLCCSFSSTEINTDGI